MLEGDGKAISRRPKKGTSKRRWRRENVGTARAGDSETRPRRLTKHDVDNVHCAGLYMYMYEIRMAIALRRENQITFEDLHLQNTLYAKYPIEQFRSD